MNYLNSSTYKVPKPACLLRESKDALDVKEPKAAHFINTLSKDSAKVQLEDMVVNMSAIDWDGLEPLICCELSQLRGKDYRLIFDFLKSKKEIVTFKRFRDLMEPNSKNGDLCMKKLWERLWKDQEQWYENHDSWRYILQSEPGNPSPDRSPSKSPVKRIITIPGRDLSPSNVSSRRRLTARRSPFHERSPCRESEDKGRHKKSKSNSQSPMYRWNSPMY